VGDRAVKSHPLIVGGERDEEAVRNDLDMPQTDTGNFNKLLTSFGLLLLGAALAIPYFYFRSTEILTTSSRELREMTETGRSSLIQRQDAIAAIEPWVVVAAILLGVIGLVLLLSGALRLKSAQVKEDEESELRRTRTRLEVDEMSPAEKAQKATERAKTEVAEEKMEIGMGASMTEPSETTTESRDTVAAPPDWQTNWTSRINVISRVSDRVHDAFRHWEIGSYEFKWQVRIGSAGSEIRVDGLFEPSIPGLPDVILSNRLVADPRLLRRNARNAANDMIALIGRYEGLTGRRAKGWIVNVIPEESEGDLKGDSSAEVEPLREALAGFGRATVINERSLDSLPDLFGSMFLDFS
jgi:hypothetical protein